MDYRIKWADIHSPAVHEMLKPLPAHPIGVSVIQYVSDPNTAVINDTGIQHIIVTSSESLKETYRTSAFVAESVEAAKLYVKYSHYIVLDHGDVFHPSGDMDFLHDDIVLLKTKTKSVDAEIYRHFYHQHTDTLSIYDIDTLITLPVVLLPSTDMFKHAYQMDHLNTHRVLDRLSVLSESNIKCFKSSFEVSFGKDDRIDSLTMLKGIDRLICQRADKAALLLLEYMNQKYTTVLKNRIDKGEVTKAETVKNLKAAKVQNIDFKTLNKGEAKKLVLAYCFPPYNDTSGNVMAKRIQAEGEVSDVISNNMNRIRKEDPKLLNIIDDTLDTQLMLDGPQAFSSWYSIERYMHDGFEAYLRFKDKYDTVYSRAMFPHSHFLGYEIKKDQPDIHWVAEFSDPLHKDVKGELREAPIDDDDYIEAVKSAVGVSNQDLITDNVFNICEILPFLFADELIFTNDYQLEDMLERFSDDVKASVRKRARISQHPSPDAAMYEIETSFYPLDEETIHMAYFGNFYDTRGFRQLALVAKYLYENQINNFKIHVFTNINSSTLRQFKDSDFKHYFKLNPYVSYFEFLNLTRRMDILMIFDAETIGIKTNNPYIPSKFSDYRGSSSIIWAFTEPGSTLDQTDEVNTWITPQHNYHEYADTFKALTKQLQKPVYSTAQIECQKSIR